MTSSVGSHYCRIAQEYSLFYALTFKMYISVTPRIMNYPILLRSLVEAPALSLLY